jgi:hypothetical protein
MWAAWPDACAREAIAVLLGNVPYRHIRISAPVSKAARINEELTAAAYLKMFTLPGRETQLIPPELDTSKGVEDFILSDQGQHDLARVYFAGGLAVWQSHLSQLK